MCTVKWGDQYSKEFGVSNGVRQGGVSSAIFFAVYINDILDVLRKSKCGCKINGVFYGAVFYADDIILLSGSRNGLQSLVNICSEFASERNLTFGTDEDPRKSKSKCIVFSKNKIVGVKKLTLYGRCLPWVDQLNYLE